MPLLAFFELIGLVVNQFFVVSVQELLGDVLRVDQVASLVDVRVPEVDLLDTFQRVEVVIDDVLETGFHFVDRLNDLEQVEVVLDFGNTVFKLLVFDAFTKSL